MHIIWKVPTSILVESRLVSNGRSDRLPPMDLPMDDTFSPGSKLYGKMIPRLLSSGMQEGSAREWDIASDADATSLNM